MESVSSNLVVNVDGNGTGASAARRALSRAIGWACTLAGGSGAFLFASVAVVVAGQAIARASGLPLVGGDEVAGWLSASASFCALAYAFRHGALIRMELFLSRLKGEWASRIELCAVGIGTVWSVTMAFAMARFVWQNAVFGERSGGLINIPIWTVQAPAVIGLVLLALAMAEQLVAVWCGERPIYVLEAEITLSSDERHSAGV